MVHDLPSSCLLDIPLIRPPPTTEQAMQVVKSFSKPNFSSYMFTRARICKRLRSLEIDSKDDSASLCRVVVPARQAT